MPLSTLGSTDGGMTSGMASHHRLWTACTVGRRRAWHTIIAIGNHTRSNDVRRGMPSLLLRSTNGRTPSGVACHHCPLTARMVGRHRAWHDITGFVPHTRSNDVRRGIPSSPLASKHGRTTSCVACHHCLWAAQTVKRRRAWNAIIAFGKHKLSNNVGRDMTSPPLDSAHGRTTSGVACHHRLWAAQIVEQSRA